ncbi:hypothetical protein L1887_57130 [Cichorium endivia]|nr:hypothetical protein L1887_57130 [Cichorium endivia]
MHVLRIVSDPEFSCGQSASRVGSRLFCSVIAHTCGPTPVRSQDAVTARSMREKECRRQSVRELRHPGIRLGLQAKSKIARSHQEAVSSQQGPDDRDWPASLHSHVTAHTLRTSV